LGNDVLAVSIDGAIATLVMTRPDKRNAMNEELLFALETFFTTPPEGVKAAILTGTAARALICQNMCTEPLKRIFTIHGGGIRSWTKSSLADWRWYR